MMGYGRINKKVFCGLMRLHSTSGGIDNLFMARESCFVAVRPPTRQSCLGSGRRTLPLRGDNRLAGLIRPFTNALGLDDPADAQRERGCIG